MLIYYIDMHAAYGELPSEVIERVVTAAGCSMITSSLFAGSPTRRAGCSLGLIGPVGATDKAGDDATRSEHSGKARVDQAHRGGARRAQRPHLRLACAGDARPDSDVDLLVEPGPAISSWFPAGLVLDLEELLGFRVDVVTDRGLRPELRATVLREAVPL